MMAGNQSLSLCMGTTLGQLHLTTTFLFLLVFGMASITAMEPPQPQFEHCI